MKNTLALVLCAALLRVRRLIWHFPGWRLLFGSGGTIQGNFVGGTLFPQNHQGRIDGYASQPSRKSRPPVKFRDVNESTKQRILESIFCVFAIFCDPQ